MKKKPAATKPKQKSPPQGKKKFPVAKLRKAAKVVRQNLKVQTPPKPAKAKGVPGDVLLSVSETMQFHPYCELLPRMLSDELEALQEDIRLHGQREPGVLLDGQILDGRNRYLVCMKLNRPFACRAFDPMTEGSPLDYIISKATHRNMTDSQKACAAVGIQEELEKESPGRSLQNLKKGSEVEPVPPREGGGHTRDKAAGLFGVSGRYVQDAKLLKEKSPDLFATVFDGSLPITRAKREYRRRIKLADMAARAKAAAQENQPHGDAWQVITGDCVKELKTLDQKARLIFADPPYNEGFDYGEGEDADSLPPARYRGWCEEWLSASVDALTEDGSLFVMINAKNHGLFWEMLKQLGLFWRNTIIWHEGFGNYTDGNFSPCARFIYYVTKQHKRYVWNGDAIRIPSERQKVYDDDRAHPAGKVPGNVWAFPRLVDNAEERIPDFPTQVPLALLERIVLACSDPGDLVLDPFNGSGSTGHAARLHGRRYLGIEKVAKNANIARARLACVTPNKESR